MIELLQLLSEQSPTLGLVMVLVMGVYLAARYFSGSELKDLRGRVDYLDDQLRVLRYRDQCYFEFVLYVEDHYRSIELDAVKLGLRLTKRKSFLAFRAEWMKDRDLEMDEEEIWK